MIGFDHNSPNNFDINRIYSPNFITCKKYEDNAQEAC